MKSMILIPSTAIRKTYVVIPLIFLSALAFAGIRGLEPRPRKSRGDIMVNSTTPLARLSLASILKKPILRRNVCRVFQSYFASKISGQARLPRQVEDSCPI
jgi:hypothetical protein